jgi:phosphoenolpyruvate carboxykinase (ATP)
LLDPRSTWSDPEDYDAEAAKLAGMFAENIARFADQLPAAVVDAGPHPAED